MKVIALAVVFLSLPSIARTQLASSASLQRIEGTDAGSGAHFVRLLLSLPPSADAPSIPPPRFTVECFDNKGKHDMRWLLSFGGIPDNGFEQPFRASQTALFPPAYPSANLRMVFEGYMKSKPFTRS
jgi:hypothetical protein